MKKYPKIIYILLGVLTGFCLAIFLGVLLFFLRVKNNLDSNGILPTITSVLPTPSQTPPFASSQDPDSILDQAEKSVEGNDLQYAADLVEPLKQLDLTVDQTIRLDAILARNEYFNGDSRTACSDYEQLYALQKNPENLYATASACYAAGEISKALDYFTDLRDWDGFEDYDYRVKADESIKAINESLGFGTPTLTPTTVPLPTRTPRPEQYPENYQYYQEANFRDGTGNITIPPGGYALFHFVSLRSIKVIDTSSISLELEKLQSDNLNMKIGIFSRTGQWLWITEPHNGNDNIMDSKDFINSDGSLYVMFVNNSSVSSISLDNASFVVVATLEDSSNYVYGFRIPGQ
jgi:tetratricopeptide (TPR) repeat protein